MYNLQLEIRIKKFYHGISTGVKKVKVFRYKPGMALGVPGG
jgi:hypothetical protein